MKLRNKSIIFIGLVIILSFGIVAYFIGDKMTITARKMSVDLALSKAQNSFLIVKKELDESILRTRLLAESIEETIDMNTKGATIINNALITNLKLRNEINAVWYIPIDSLIDLKNGVYYLENSSCQSVMDKKHLMAGQLLQSKIETISAPYRGTNNRLISSILVPVIRDHSIIGVLGADLDLYRFQQHFYDNEALSRAYVSIISEQGYCISHPEQNHIGKSIDSLYDADAIREVLSTGKKKHNELHSNFLQLPVIRVYQPIKIGETNINWLITVSVPLFNVEEAVQEVRNSTALIGIVLAFLLMVFLYYSQRRWLSEFEGRQRAETKHRNILNKLSSIMESTDQIRIFSIDRKYRYTSFNSVYKKDAIDNEGIQVEVGMSALNTYHGEFGELMKTYFDKALRGEHFLTEYSRNDRHYQQVFNAIFDENERVIGFSSFRFDISETVELRKRAQKEEEEKVKAQLKNIKNQINPHFLFNSLNSLYALVETEPQLARKFVLKLSKVYRYLLDQNNSSLIDLKQELDFVQHYIFLQKIRFGGNLRLNYDIPNSYMNAKLPSVSLQSLVENAIKHNIITSEKPLLISMRIEDNKLVVENNYQLRSDFESNSGTGLKTLNALYAFLGEKQSEYGVEGSKFVVRLPLL